MGFTQKLKGSPKLKALALWLLMPTGQARPRLWVKWFFNPWIHKRGKGSHICWNTRIDVLPFNTFSLGKGSTIEDFATINNGVGSVIIGDHTRIGIGCVVIGPVTIGNEVMLAQNIVLSGLNHGYSDITRSIASQPVSTAPIVVEDEAWIGANSVVTAGVTIGKHAVIAGGSVVTKSVPPYTVVAGNPAKPIKAYNKETGNWEKLVN